MEDRVRGRDVTVIIPTFGNLEKWSLLALRATDSVYAQTVPAEPIRVHGLTLAEARNNGASLATTEWLIFLDADDELDPTYVEYMLSGEGDIRQPSTLGVVDGKEDDFPVLIPPHPGGFMIGNHLIIGCMVRKSLFDAVGGFRDLPALEDWDLWIRMRLEGATVGACPDAIYRVHVNPNSRNQNTALHAQTYAAIQQRYMADWQLKGLH